MSRSAISVPSNIAEGLGRKHPKDKVKFMYIARGSAFELETQVMIAQDLGFLNDQKLTLEIERSKKLISGMIKYLHREI